jgi:CheY-like chemotaxis protein
MTGVRAVGRYILVVDDDPDAREILDLVLATLDIPVVQARDGREALHLIDDDCPLLLVLDLSMPTLDGRAVLERLRAKPETAALPVLVFTADNTGLELSEELRVPLSRIMRKGNLSMTRLRSIAIEVLGSAVKADI